MSNLQSLRRFCLLPPVGGVPNTGRSALFDKAGSPAGERDSRIDAILRHRRRRCDAIAIDPLGTQT
jgi:hypothetical protein